MKILIDSREQRPLKFSNSVEVERVKLDFADYTISGLEELISVERKALNDLALSFGKSRDRFMRMVAKMNSKHKFLLIEGSLANVYRGEYRSAIHPNSVVGTINSLCVKENVQTLFYSNAQFAALALEDLFKKFYEFHNKGG